MPAFCFLPYIIYTAFMRKDVLIMLFGAFVAFLPFLGFPNSWDTIFLVIAGVCMIALGIAVRRGGKPMRQVQMYSSQDRGVGDATRHEA
jgi:hypothetical protein